MLDGFSDHRYELALFMNAPIALAYVDTNGRFLRVNHVWTEMLGYTIDELENLTFQEITHPADIKADTSMMKKILANPVELDSYTMIKRYVGKEGKTIWATLYGTAIVENNKVVHFIATVVPLPNGGKFRVESVDNKTVNIRPTVTFWQFVRDNWQWFIGLILPVIAGTTYFIFKLVAVMSRVLDKLDITW